MKNQAVPILVILFVLLSSACIGGSAKNAEMTLNTKAAELQGTYNAKEISASEFIQMYKNDGYTLIDVRTPVEYNSGHIPGAVNIPHTEIADRISELGLSRDSRIVLICEAGVRSKKAANALLNEGYTDITDVTDGMRVYRVLGGDMEIPLMMETEQSASMP